MRDFAPSLWHDTPQRYGMVTRALHWGIAALILWQFLCMIVKVSLGKHPLTAFLVGTHAPVGAAIFALVVLRLIWGGLQRGRRPPHGAGLMGRAARLGHGALYAGMFVVPALALLRAWGGERAFAPFGFEIFPAREAALAWTQGGAHGLLAWALGLLILGHIVMALLHDHLWRDGTLAKMAGRNLR